MALNDPQSVTIDGTANSLPLIAREDGKSKYQSSDEKLVLEVWHSGNVRRKRLSHRASQTYTVTDPLTGLVKVDGTTVSINIDRPTIGRPAADDIKLARGLALWLTDVILGRTMGGES